MFVRSQKKTHLCDSSFSIKKQVWLHKKTSQAPCKKSFLDVCLAGLLARSYEKPEPCKTEPKIVIFTRTIKLKPFSMM